MRGFLGQDLEKQQQLTERYLELEEEATSNQNSAVMPKSPQPSASLIATGPANFCVNSLQIYGQEKYLVCREVDIFSLRDKLSEPELLCDVVLLMYDLSNPKSFEYVARIYLKHFNDCKLPVLVLGAKSDQAVARQLYSQQPEEFCAKYKLPKPHVFTANHLSNGNVQQDVFVKLGTMAAYPNLRRLVHVLLMRPTTSWVTGNLGVLQRVLPQSTTLVRAGLGLATLALAGLFALRLLRAAGGGSGGR